MLLKIEITGVLKKQNLSIIYFKKTQMRTKHIVLLLLSVVIANTLAESTFLSQGSGQSGKKRLVQTTLSAAVEAESDA